MNMFRIACGVIGFVAATGWSAAADPFPKVDGYRGIWYANQPSDDEYRYKYSGGLGTYCAKHIPMAVYAPDVNKTFFVYGGTKPGERALLEMASYYDHATGEVPQPTLVMDKKTSDAHDNPVIALDDDGHIWVFCSSHGTSRPSFLYRSTAPYSVDDFELMWETNFSYPQPWWMPNKGFFFLHTKYGGGRRLFTTTSTDGREWTEPAMLAHIEEGHYQVSWRHGERVATAFNYHPAGKGLNYRTNLYYVESPDMGRTWTTANGTPVETPLTEVANAALIRDYASEGLLVYMKDLTFDPEGRPAILHVTSKGYEAGPENGPRVWRVAHWTGERWAFHAITESDNNYDTGTLHIEPGGLWRVIGPTETGPQAYNPGGEMAMWVSHDHGETWTKEHTLTAGSPYNHTYARKPVNANPGFYAYWADGHGRQPSDSRLYFATQDGAVYRLPEHMDTPTAKPERINP